MILLLEPDKKLGKRISDLLDRERIDVVESERQVLEMVVKYKDDINAIIANHRQFSVILAHQLITQVCLKLDMKLIPAVGYHIKGDPEPLAEHRSMPGYRLIDCDESDPGFPEKFIKTLREAYPDVNVEIEKAKMLWAAKPEDLMDVGKWLEEAGFGQMDKIAQTAAPVVPKTKPKPPEPPKKPAAPPKKLAEPPKKPAEPPKGPPDYKKMYEDLKKEHDQLKKKHDELLKQVKDIINL